MSNWMTSGSARLKAKQNSSFSRRARQRAAVVAPDGAMLKEIAHIKRLPRTKPRRNEAKRRYSYGNPITRRGAAVSIGSAATYNQRCDDDPIESTLPSNIITTENLQSLNETGSLSSGNYTSYNPVSVLPRRRIRDLSSRYHRCSSNLKITSNQTASSNHDISQCTASHTHHPAYAHHPSNRSFYQQKDSPFYNNHTSNGVYTDNAQKVPYQFLRPHVLGSETVALNSASQLLPSNHYRNKDFKCDSHTLEELQEQEALGTTIYQNHDHAQLSFDNESFQKGIQRFQKREKDPLDLMNPFDKRKNDSWNMNNDGADDILERKRRYSAPSGNGNNFRIESKEQWQPRQRQQHFLEPIHSSDKIRWKEHENEESFFEQLYQKKLHRNCSRT